MCIIKCIKDYGQKGVNKQYFNYISDNKSAKSNLRDSWPKS